MPGSWHHLGTELRSCCWQSTGDGRQQTCTGQGPAPPGIRDHQEEQPLALGHLHKPSPAGKPRLREPVTPRQSLGTGSILSFHSSCHPWSVGTSLQKGGFGPTAAAWGSAQLFCGGNTPGQNPAPDSKWLSLPQTGCELLSYRHLCAPIPNPKPGTDTSVP